jgi:hypothetical protein
VLTFDQHFASPDDELRALMRSGLPDEVEVAETEEYWVRAKRSEGKVLLISKITGHAVATLSPEATVWKVMLSEKQYACLLGVLNLRDPRGDVEQAESPAALPGLAAL